MSYSNSMTAHRWVHGQFGRDGEVRGNNMHGNTVSMYSYSTVIAQCLDRERKVFLVIDKNLTPSTSKHINYVNRAIPGSAHVFYTHFVGQYSYDNVKLLNDYAPVFDKKKRLELVSDYIRRQHGNYMRTAGAASADSDNVSKEFFDDIERLDKIYGDCSLKIWLRNVKGADKSYRKMVRMYLNGKSDAEIVDALFGAGTWDGVIKRIAPKKKAEASRKHGVALKSHLLYRESRYSSNDRRIMCPYTMKEIRKLSPRQILDIRFENLALMEEGRFRIKEYSSHRNGASHSFFNAAKFLGIERSVHRTGARLIIRDSLGNVVYNDEMLSHWDGSLYIPFGNEWWNKTDVYFYMESALYHDFKASPDKFSWRKRFWQMCQLKTRRLRGSYLYGKMKVYEQYNRPFEISEEDSHILNEYVVRKQRYDALEEKREKEACARRERELKEKMERIAIYHEQGLDGIRKIWRERLQSVDSDILYSGELCYGGNILMRLAKQYGYIETSKGIRMTFKDAHRCFDIIKKWHDNGTFDKGVRMAGYLVNSFDNDILVAGCHQIAFCEMQRMYDEMCAVEAEPA